jgi:hypothetical protein
MTAPTITKRSYLEKKNKKGIQDEQLKTLHRMTSPRINQIAPGPCPVMQNHVMFPGLLLPGVQMQKVVFFGVLLTHKLVSELFVLKRVFYGRQRESTKSPAKNTYTLKRRSGRKGLGRACVLIRHRSMLPECRV